MAAMTTALTEFADNGNSRTYTRTGHTALEPELLIQKRKIPSTEDGMVENVISVIATTDDADGAVLPRKVVFEASCRYPVNGTYTDVTALLAVFRDVIAGDEFTNTVQTQEWLS